MRKIGGNAGYLISTTVQLPVALPPMSPNLLSHFQNPTSIANLTTIYSTSACLKDTYPYLGDLAAS